MDYVLNLGKSKFISKKLSYEYTLVIEFVSFWYELPGICYNDELYSNLSWQLCFMYIHKLKIFTCAHALHIMKGVLCSDEIKLKISKKSCLLLFLSTDLDSV